MNSVGTSKSPGTAKTGKKLLALLLSLCMILSLMPAMTIGAAAAAAYTRTTKLDLSVTSVSYKDSAGQTKTANPTAENITDTGEGWSWYYSATNGTPYGDVAANTLVLDGFDMSVTLEGNANESAGIYAPKDLNVLLAENSVNTIDLGANSFNRAIVINSDNGYSYGMNFSSLGSGDSVGSLTITLADCDGAAANTHSRGIVAGGLYGSFTMESGKLNITTGDITSTKGELNYGISAGNIVVRGGEIAITTGATTMQSPSHYGLYASQNMEFSGGKVTIDGGDGVTANKSFAIYSKGDTPFAVSGSAEITVSGGYRYGIYNYGVSSSMTIEDGTLDITAANGAIFANGPISMTGGNVTAIADNSDTSRYGIQCKALSVAGGIVKASGTGVYPSSSAINATSYNLTGMSAIGNTASNTFTGLTPVTVSNPYMKVGTQPALSVVIEPLPAGTLCILTSLEAAGIALSPAFDSGVTYYTATVPNATENVTISAEPYAGSVIDAASCALNTPVSLNVGENDLLIRVTRADTNETNDYHVIITREAAPVAEQLLTALNLVDPNGSNFEYEGEFGTLDAGACPVTVDLADDASYPTNKTSLKLNFTATEGTTVYTGYANAESPGTAVISGSAVDFTNTVTLTAVNGATVQTYTVTAVSKGAGTQQYGLKLEAAGGHFNVGESVTFDVYATTPASDNTNLLDIGSYQFDMSYDDTYLNFAGYTPTFDGSKTTNSTVADKVTVKLVANRAIPMTYFDAGDGTYAGRIKLGTVTFTVKNTIPEQANDVATQEDVNGVFALSELEVTPNGYSRNALAPTTEATTVTSADGIVAHNQTITFQSDTTGTVTNSPVKAYVKYGEIGIWYSNSYTGEFFVPGVQPAEFYMPNGSWRLTGRGDGPESVLSEPNLTITKLLNTTTRLPDNLTAVPITVPAVKVTYNIPSGMGDWGSLLNNYSPYILAAGTTFENATKPTPTPENGYKFVGWSLDQTGETLLTDAYEFAWGDGSHEYTVYAIFAHDSYDWTDSSGANVTVSDLTGVNEENKVTYDTDVTFKLTPNANYEITAVSYTVGEGEAQPITAGEGGVYTIPGDAILGAVTLNVVTNNYIELTYNSGEKFTDAGFTYTIDGGVPQTAAKLYAKYGVAGFYLDKACTTAVTLAAPATVATLEAGAQYRLPTGEEPVFHDGTTGYTMAALNAATFTADKTLTAQATKQYQVGFAITDTLSSGATFGTLGQAAVTTVAAVWVDEGMTLKAAGVAIPKLSLNPGYSATWTPKEPAEGDAFNAAITYTATIAHGSYTMNLGGIGADITIPNGYPEGADDGDVTDDDIYDITHGTDVVIKLDPTDGDNDVIPDDNITITIDGKDYDVTPDPDTGEITIPGKDITGPIVITASTVVYRTITFASNTGATLTPALTDLVYYAVNGEAGLYDTLADLKTGTLTYTAPTAAAASEDYRLDNLTAAGQYWITEPASTDYTTNGIFGTTGEPGQLATQSFTADTTLYAKTIRLYDVTFAAGANTTLTEKPLTITVDASHELTAAEIPTQGYATGWEFDNWTNDLNATTYAALEGVAITGDITFTLNAKRQTYNFTSTDGQGAFTVTPVSGITEGKVTYQLTDVSFSVAQGDGYRINSLTYTIGGGEPITPEPAGSNDKPYDGTYTILAADVTGDIAVTITTAETTNVTFTYWDATAGTLTKTTTAAVLPSGTLFESQLTAATALAAASHAAGQEFKGWSTDGTNVIADATILANVVTAEANNAYTAVYGLAERTITDDDDLLEMVKYMKNGDWYQTTDGVHPKLQYIAEGELYTYGYVELTPVTGKVVTELFYSVTDPDTGVAGPTIRLTPEADGTYRLPGTAVTGDITITGTVLDSTAATNPSIEFITRAAYKAITSETAGRKIMVLNGTASNETYTLGDGTVLFWSSRYSAHVCWVNDAETALTIAAKGVTQNTGANAAAVNYNGDVNGDSHVTAADAQFVNDCLHNERIVPTSAMQLFRLDVTNSIKEVTSADELWILNR